MDKHAHTDHSSIAAKIVAHINQGISEDENLTKIDASNDLIDSGALDSLTIVQLIQFIETEFCCSINDDDIDADLFASANHLAQYVLNHR